MNQDESIEVVGEWDDDLVWCPSQCFLSVRWKGKNYTLYLIRWTIRNCTLYPHLEGQHPWRGYMIKEYGTGDQSPDLLDLYHEQYSADELGLAKEALIRLANRWIKENDYGQG